WSAFGFRRGLLHPPLAELARLALVVEPDDEHVAVGLAFERVARLPDRYRGVAVDRDGPVLRLPAAGLVRAAQPVGDDRLAASDRCAVRPVAVDDVLAEQRTDVLGLAGSPGGDIPVEPRLEHGVI